MKYLAKAKAVGLSPITRSKDFIKIPPIIQLLRSPKCFLCATRGDALYYLVAP